MLTDYLVVYMKLLSFGTLLSTVLFCSFIMWRQVRYCKIRVLLKVLGSGFMFLSCQCKNRGS